MPFFTNRMKSKNFESLKKPKDYFVVKKGINGLGLFTKLPIKKKMKILEYVGEMITAEEANKRGGKYLFEISSRRTVDGKGRENLARYINHSCDPNCETEIDGSRIFAWSLKKDIEPNEELTYDYGKEYFNEYIKPKGCNCSKCSKKKLKKSK